MRRTQGGGLSGCAVLLLVLSFCGRHAALAFLSTDLAANLMAAPGSMTHEGITRTAVLNVLSRDLEVKVLSTEAALAITAVIQANAGVDQDQSHSELHFDGENFEGGQAILVAGFAGTIAGLQQAAYELAHEADPSKALDTLAAVRAALGRTLHTLQDFYSHTNWVELGNADPHLGLGWAGVVLESSPPDERACEDCPWYKRIFAACRDNVVTTRLTSGYYGGEDRGKAAGKCSHGGPEDTSSYSDAAGGINKDANIYFLSPHSHLHFQAADLAVAATDAFLARLAAASGRVLSRLLYGLDPVPVPAPAPPEPDRRRWPWAGAGAASAEAEAALSAQGEEATGPARLLRGRHR
eukprot:tig00000215_g18597.t1